MTDNSGGRPSLGDTAERMAALKAHPRFPYAVQRFAEAIASHYRNRWLLNRLLNDRGRFLLAMLALDLHYHGDSGQARPGLTAGRLRMACVDHAVCSAGRAGAMLATMRLFGLLAEAPSHDRRERLLVPTEQLLAMHRERFRKVFAAISEVAPQGANGLANIDDESFLAAFIHELVLRFRSGLRPLQWAPQLAVFAERDAGMMMALSLLAAHPPDGTEGESHGAEDMSIARIAGRYSVSRAHVLGVLRHAEDTGLLRRTAGNRITVTPRLVDSFHDFFAGVIVLQGDAIAGALLTLAPDVSRRA